jgi:hypothetical protein
MLKQTGKVLSHCHRQDSGTMLLLLALEYGPVPPPITTDLPAPSIPSSCPCLEIYGRLIFLSARAAQAAILLLALAARRKIPSSVLLLLLLKAPMPLDTRLASSIHSSKKTTYQILLVLSFRASVPVIILPQSGEGALTPNPRCTPLEYLHHNLNYHSTPSFMLAEACRPEGKRSASSTGGQAEGLKTDLFRSN